MRNCSIKLLDPDSYTKENDTEPYFKVIKDGEEGVVRIYNVNQGLIKTIFDYCYFSKEIELTFEDKKDVLLSIKNVSSSYLSYIGGKLTHIYSTLTASPIKNTLPPISDVDVKKKTIEYDTLLVEPIKGNVYRGIKWSIRSVKDHLCGYIHHEDMKLLKKVGYEIYVHGEWTFGPEHAEFGEDITLGFDCAHYCDLSLLYLETPEFLTDGMEFRSIDYVLDELKRVIDEMYDKKFI